MGVVYSVACRDCKVHRDLQKFYTLRPAQDRSEAIQLETDLQHNQYQAVLLVSFLAEHMGHNCTVFTDQFPHLSEELDPIFNKTMKFDDRDFWDAPVET